MTAPDFSDGNMEIYRVGATVGIDIHPTDFRQNSPLAQVELRCPIPEQDEANNIPPPIPVPDRTWIHIDRDGNQASFTSDTPANEFFDIFPLLDPLVNMGIFFLNTNPQPVEAQDSPVLED